MRPTLMQIGPGRGGRRRSRPATAPAPALLKPIRLMIALCETSRNRRGRSFPRCGRGVTVPISTHPNPSRNQAGASTSPLSIPAARPSGVGKSIPQSV